LKLNKRRLKIKSDYNDNFYSIRVRKNQVLSKIGRAFETGLQSEEESEKELEDN